jgi:hypothetical protein
MVRITTNDPELQKQLDNMEFSNLTELMLLGMMSEVFKETYNSHLFAISDEWEKGATEIIDAYYLPQLRRYSKLNDKVLTACVITACHREMAKRYKKSKE